MKEIILNSKYVSSKNYGKFVALVDDKDFDTVNKFYWSVNESRNTLYVVGRVDGVKVKLHNFIMGAKNIDHINHNTLDNRRCNLRVVTKQQNNFNKRPVKHSSKFKGVYWFKPTNRWHAQIALNKKKIHIGFYKDEIEAAQAYNRKATELHGEFAYLNHV